MLQSQIRRVLVDTVRGSGALEEFHWCVGDGTVSPTNSVLCWGSVLRRWISEAGYFHREVVGQRLGVCQDRLASKG